jgi:hypothetical protein
MTDREQHGNIREIDINDEMRSRSLITPCPSSSPAHCQTCAMG